MSESRVRSAIVPLVEGYRQFKDHYFDQNNLLYHKLVKFGQRPKVLTIACCDARVDPAIVTDCNPGDMFVVRNVANIVPPFEDNPGYHGTSAALEFGVCSLGVTDIIVFGHSFCGGIQALMDRASETPSDFVSSWMKIAAPAKEKVRAHHAHLNSAEQARQCEKETLLISLQNLMTFPWIASRVQSGELALHAWHFDLETGVIEAYRRETEAYSPL